MWRTSSSRRVASSPGLGAEERAEWHVARGRLLCERQESKDGEEANKPDVRAARAAFERAARLVDEPPAGGDAPPTALASRQRALAAVLVVVVAAKRSELMLSER